MKEDRVHLFQDYLRKFNVNPDLVWSWLLYDRYYEANILRRYLLKKGITKFHGLDYGCGVGDYGVYLLKHFDCSMDFHDFDYMLDFVKFRLKDQTFNAKYIIAVPSALKDKLGDYTDIEKHDLVIFGEVLEHLKNPDEVLEECLDNKVRFVLTTSYPYREDLDHFKKGGHLMEAGKLQPVCRKLLENNYNFYNPEGGLRIWELKL